MPGQLKEKETKFSGKLAGDGRVRSFTGKINGGRDQTYIAVELDEWLSLLQAKRLVRILNDHIQRVEMHQGVSFTSGSRTLTKRFAKVANKDVESLSDAEVDRFVEAVLDLAEKKFQYSETVYKWGRAAGQKSRIDITLEAWRTLPS